MTRRFIPAARRCQLTFFDAATRCHRRIWAHAHHIGMRIDQLVLRDIVRTSFAISVITTAAILVARQHRPLPSYTPAASPVGTARSPVALGAELYERKGCVTCHTV